jgi:hypothetical protein
MAVQPDHQLRHIFIRPRIQEQCAFCAVSGISQLKWSWFSKTKRPLRDIMTYDDASRGVWGAANLIWKLKLRDLIATLAAFIMIVALALDPLAQQLVKFYSCEQSFTDAQPTILARKSSPNMAISSLRLYLLSLRA